VQAYLYPTLSINLEDVSDLLVDAVPILTFWGGVKESAPQQRAGSEPHLLSKNTRPPVDSQAASTSQTEPERASQAHGAHFRTTSQLHLPAAQQVSSFSNQPDKVCSSTSGGWTACGPAENRASKRCELAQQQAEARCDRAS
jgi:hypothetical protein